MGKVRFKLSWVSAFVLSVSCSQAVYSADVVAPEQFLLDQMLLGETHYRDDLVQQSLARLELIDPNNPVVILARLRLALRQGNKKRVEDQFNKLKLIAPNSQYYREAQVSLALAQPQGQQKLQQARVFAMAQKVNEAKAIYDELFQGYPPTPELSFEYWNLVSRVPGQEQNAQPHLLAIYDYLKDHHVIQMNENTNGWENSLIKRLSDLAYEQGSKALKKGNLLLAQRQFLKSYDFYNKNDSALVGLGDIAFKQKQYAVAEASYKHALLLYPDGISAVYGLAHIYELQSPEKALHYLTSLPQNRQTNFKDLINRLKDRILQKQAERLTAENKLTQALEKYREASQISPNDIWLTYHFAKLLHKMGRDAEANRVFQQLKSNNKNNPDVIYAYSLFLSNINQDQQALNLLNALPLNRWNKSMHELSRQLQQNIALEHAKMLRDKGDKQAANEFLLFQPQTIQIKLTLADWALADGNNLNALTLYKEAIQIEPQNYEAHLGEIEALVAMDRKNEAWQSLLLLENEPGERSTNELRRVANAWSTVGEVTKAEQLFTRIKKTASQEKPSPNSALVFRDAADLDIKLHKPQTALDDYREAMVQSEIASVYPKDNITFTRLMRNNPTDDWLKKSIKKGASKVYKQQEVRVTVEQDKWMLKGTPGISQQNTDDTIIQADMPLYDGRLFLRGDMVKISAGDFVTTNGVYFEDFGTCGTFGCSTGISQVQNGTSLALGWQNDRWNMDLGVSPIGFPVVNLIGGINYSGKFHKIGWTLGVSQRLLNNSLLSLAGTQDPATGIIWGGVVSTGPSLSLSYDQGEANGLWANISGDSIRGVNVANNARFRLMDGYYYKLINEENRRFSVGLNNMIWFYQRDLSGYTLGQGGYYSPQRYLSFAVPVNFRRRTDNWSYELGGSGTWTRATIGDNILYPLPNLVPNLLAGDNVVSSGSTSSGFGYTLLALFERRLGSHFVLGGVVDIQRSRDYTPSHASIYLRYTHEGWQGDMDMPLKPIVPYANYQP